MPCSAPAHLDRQCLPDELMVHILAQALVLLGGQKIDKTLHDQLFQGYLAPIIATRNRRLVDLALELYYHKNTFVIEIRARGFSRPSPAKCSEIRHLHVTITECRMAKELETMLLHPGSSWRWLLEPLHPLDPPPYNPIPRAQLLAPSEIVNSTAWQKNFRELRTLKFETKLDRKWARLFPGPPRIRRADRGFMSQWEVNVKKSDIHLKACKVDVALGQHYDPAESWEVREALRIAFVIKMTKNIGSTS